MLTACLPPCSMLSDPAPCPVQCHTLNNTRSPVEQCHLQSNEPVPCAHRALLFILNNKQKSVSVSSCSVLAMQLKGCSVIVTTRTCTFSRGCIVLQIDTWPKREATMAQSSDMGIGVLVFDIGKTRQRRCREVGIAAKDFQKDVADT